MRRWRWLWWAAVLAVALLPQGVLASGNQADPNPRALGEWTAAWLDQAQIEGMRSLATAAWWAEKLAAGTTRLLIERNLWLYFLETLLDSLRATMPDTLHGLLLGETGAGGLVYLALVLAGLLLLVPQIGQGPPLVRAERVLLWTIVVLTLFVGSLVGYDLVGYVESIRQKSAYVALETIGEDGRLDELVATPMLAEPEEMDQYDLTLPGAFQAAYFPDPDPDALEEAVIFHLFSWDWTLSYESEASRAERQALAETGLAVALLTLVPGAILFGFGLILAALAAAAMVLIIFFIVSLPLGFFEFGTAILIGIVRQYTFLFAQTLLAVALIGIVAGAGRVTGAAPLPGPGDLLPLLPLYLITGIATAYNVQMAASALQGTAGIVTASLRGALAPLAVTGSLPAAGGVPGAGFASLAATALAGATGVAGGAALAGAFGGAQAALAAGAGQALGQLPGQAGAVAGSWATQQPAASPARHIFASAAGGASALQVARTAGRFRQGAGAFQAAQQGEGTQEVGWGRRDAAAFTTTDLHQLDQAEAAYDRGDRDAARRHLTHAFGRRAVAEQALARYDAGPRGRNEVRAAVEVAQATAAQVVAEGGQVWGREGQPSRAFQHRLVEGLTTRGLWDGQDARAGARLGQLAGAAVRQPVGIWALPEAAQMLAAHTLEAEPDQSVTGTDQAAQLALQALAREQGWQMRHLTSLFEGLRGGLAAHAQQPERRPATLVAAELAGRHEFERVPDKTRHEAARLAVLVAAEAQADRGMTLEIPVPPTSEETR